MADPLPGASRQLVFAGDPFRHTGKKRLAGEVSAVDKAVCHGDEKEPLGFTDLLVEDVVGAVDEEVQVPKDLLPVFLDGGGGGHLLAGVLLPCEVSVAPAKDRGTGIVDGQLPENCVRPSLTC